MAPSPVTIAVDAGGADLGVAEVVAGAGLAVAADPSLTVLVFGAAAGVEGLPAGVELVDAPRSIAKEPDPVRAVRAARDASVVQAVDAVASGRAAAVVSGGSTGAVLAAGLFGLRRLPGVHRPALAAPVPVPGHPVLLLDVGANVEARVEHLVQFAHMGAAFAAAALGVGSPRVGVLSNGEEPARGTDAVREAVARLRGTAGMSFVGPVEGTALMAGAADVVVCDGFTGNVALKVMEGTSAAVMRAIRARVESAGAAARAGGILLRPALRGLRDEIDPETAGGALLLGLRSTVVVPHGRFARSGWAAAIALAARAVREDVGGRTHAALEAAGALRPRPPVEAAPPAAAEPETPAAASEPAVAAAVPEPAPAPPAPRPGRPPATSPVSRPPRFELPDEPSAPGTRVQER